MRQTETTFEPSVLLKLDARVPGPPKHIWEITSRHEETLLALPREWQCTNTTALPLSAAMDPKMVFATPRVIQNISAERLAILAHKCLQLNLVPPMLEYEHFRKAAEYKPKQKLQGAQVLKPEEVEKFNRVAVIQDIRTAENTPELMSLHQGMKMSDINRLRALFAFWGLSRPRSLSSQKYQASFNDGAGQTKGENQEQPLEKAGPILEESVKQILSTRKKEISKETGEHFDMTNGIPWRVSTPLGGHAAVLQQNTNVFAARIKQHKVEMWKWMRREKATELCVTELRSNQNLPEQCVTDFFNKFGLEAAYSCENKKFNGVAVAFDPRYRPDKVFRHIEKTGMLLEQIPLLQELIRQGKNKGDAEKETQARVVILRYPKAIIRQQQRTPHPRKPEKRQKLCESDESGFKTYDADFADLYRMTLYMDYRAKTGSYRDTRNQMVFECLKKIYENGDYLTIVGDLNMILTPRSGIIIVPLGQRVEAKNYMHPSQALKIAQELQIYHPPDTEQWRQHLKENGIFCVYDVLRTRRTDSPWQGQDEKSPTSFGIMSRYNVRVQIDYYLTNLLSHLDDAERAEVNRNHFDSDHWGVTNTFKKHPVQNCIQGISAQEEEARYLLRELFAPLREYVLPRHFSGYQALARNTLLPRMKEYLTLRMSVTNSEEPDKPNTQIMCHGLPPYSAFEAKKHSVIVTTFGHLRRIHSYAMPQSWGVDSRAVINENSLPGGSMRWHGVAKAALYSLIQTLYPFASAGNGGRTHVTPAATEDVFLSPGAKGYLRHTYSYALVYLWQGTLSAKQLPLDEIEKIPGVKAFGRLLETYATWPERTEGNESQTKCELDKDTPVARLTPGTHLEAGNQGALVSIYYGSHVTAEDKIPTNAEFRKYRHLMPSEFEMFHPAQAIPVLQRLHKQDESLVANSALTEIKVRSQAKANDNPLVQLGSKE